MPSATRKGRGKEALSRSGGEALVQSPACPILSLPWQPQASSVGRRLRRQPGTGLSRWSLQLTLLPELLVVP